MNLLVHTRVPLTLVIFLLTTVFKSHNQNSEGLLYKEPNGPMQVLVSTLKWYGVYITYTMASRDLPDIYALARRPQARERG